MPTKRAISEIEKEAERHARRLAKAHKPNKKARAQAMALLVHGDQYDTDESAIEDIATTRVTDDYIKMDDLSFATAMALPISQLERWEATNPLFKRAQELSKQARMAPLAEFRLKKARGDNFETDRTPDSFAINEELKTAYPEKYNLAQKLEHSGGIGVTHEIGQSFADLMNFSADTGRSLARVKPEGCTLPQALMHLSRRRKMFENALYGHAEEAFRLTGINYFDIPADAMTEEQAREWLAGQGVDELLLDADEDEVAAMTNTGIRNITMEASHA